MSKPTPRAEAWIDVLGGVEAILEQRLADVSRREAACAATDTNGPTHAAAIAKASERWAGLWVRSAEGEKVFGVAESALATMENELRERLDALVACRQNLAQWLDGAVG